MGLSPTHLCETRKFLPYGYAADCKSSKEIFNSRSSCFAAVVFCVAFIVVSFLKDGNADEVLKADGFEEICCDIIVAVAVGGGGVGAGVGVVVGGGVGCDDNENDNDDDNDEDIGEIDCGVDSMAIEENIDDNICTPPLFDFVFPVTYRWIILYCDP